MNEKLTALDDWNVKEHGITYGNVKGHGVLVYGNNDGHGGEEERGCRWHLRVC